MSGPPASASAFGPGERPLDTWARAGTSSQGTMTPAPWLQNTESGELSRSAVGRSRCPPAPRLVRAGLVAPEGAQQPPPSLGISGHLPGVIPQSGHRHGSGEHRFLPHRLRRIQPGAHLLEIRHGPAHLGPGQLQPEVVPGLQQNTLRLHQSLAHRPVGGLAEVPALRVLHVGPARHQGDLHVRDGGSGQHPQVLLLCQVGQHQPLPAPLQLILRAGGGKHQAAAPLPRLQQQVDLRVMAQGLKVADALHRGGDGLR